MRFCQPHKPDGFCGEFVHTPKPGSRLNAAENELSVLKRVGNEEESRKQIADHQARRNKKEIEIDWQFTAKDARVKSKRLYPPIKSRLITSKHAL